MQTLFFTESGVVQLTDYMPWSGDDENFSVHEVHRLIEAQEGSVEMEVVFDPKFDYGRLETRVTPADEGALAEGPNGERLARLDLALRQRDESVEAAPLHAADSRHRRTR